MARIVIADDDADIRELVVFKLRHGGHEVVPVGDGAAAVEACTSDKPDLVILDVMMPGMSGLDAARALRANNVMDDLPIIMLTARAQESDIEQGLAAGADDYIVKPFSPREVVARIKAVLRRASEQPKSDTSVITYNGLTIDLKSYTVTLRNQPVICTPKEIEILHMLASNPGQVFTREQLLSRVWGYDFAGETRTVDTHIKRIRAKLDSTGLGWSIKTIYGVGYKFETE